MEPVVRNQIEGLKCFASLRCALLKVFIEHFFPARRVDLRSVRNHTVEIKQDRVVPVAVDHACALGPSHRSLSFTKGIPPVSDNRLDSVLRHGTSESDNDKISR
jgi:hypothetical protein